MIPSADPTDAVDGFLASLSAARQLGLGALLLASGLGLSWRLARSAARWLPRPASGQGPAGEPTAALSRPIPAGALARPIPAGALARPIVVALAFVVVLASGLLAAKLLGVPPPPAAVDLRRFAATNLAVTAALLLFLAGWARAHRTTLADLGLVARGALRPVAFALLFYVAFAPAQVGAMALERAFFSFLGREPAMQAAVEAFADEPALHGDLVVLLGIVVAAPLTEELLFRGLLLPLVRRFAPLGVAIAVTALPFCLLHDAGRLPVFVLGVALGWLALRTGNLLAPIAFHVLHNGLVLFLLANSGGD